MGFPLDFFPVLFAIPRVVGWLAHWKESLEEKGGKIWRPRQVYIVSSTQFSFFFTCLIPLQGEGQRTFVPLNSRDSARKRDQPFDEYIKTMSDRHPFSKRSLAADWRGKEESKL